MNNKKLILAIFAGILIGAFLMSLDSQNIYDQGFTNGVQYAAAYTTQTGNFTFFGDNGKIEQQSLTEYCYEYIQYLNQQGGK